MRGMNLIAVLLVAFIFYACQEVSMELNEQQRIDITAEVDAAASIWWNAWATMDFEKGMSFISPAPEASWIGDEQNLYGVAAMREMWSKWSIGLAKQDINFTDSRTIVLSPDIAYTIRNYTGIQTMDDGSVLPQIAGVETLMWVKKNGKWKILLGHESTLKESWQTRLNLEMEQ